MAIFRPMALAAALCASPAMASPVEKPQRIVSLNLCTDQLVLRLAPVERVASVTYLARDPDISSVADIAAGVPINHGFAEEVIPLKPDLVLAGAYTTRATTHILRRFGVPVLVLEPADGLAGAIDTVTKVAAALGESEAGRDAIRRMRRAADVPARTTPGPTAVVLRPNGFVVGKGSLADDIMSAAGLRNLSAEASIGGFGFVRLERIVAARPEILIIGPRRRTPSLAEIYLRHPALSGSSGWAGDDVGRARRVEVPARLWNCAGPQNAEAIALLSDAVRARRVEAGHD